MNDSRATLGEEWYLRVFGRTFDLLASGHQSLYESADPICEPRIAELQDILRLVRAWHDSAARVGELQGMSKKEANSHFFSHQLYFDIQMMIEGFIGLVRYRELRWGSASVRPRSAASQDSLESLFGRLRYSCGGATSVSMARALAALNKIDRQTDVRWAHRQGSNSAGAAAAAGPVRSGLADREAIRLPTDFDAVHQRALQHPAVGSPVLAGIGIHWRQIRDAQAEDEARLVGRRPKRMFWLKTSTHMNKTGFSRMRVGLARDVISPRTAAQLQLRRYGL